MLLHDVIMTSFVVPVKINLLYVKLRGLATKIRFWSKPCVILNRVPLEYDAKKLIYEVPENGWIKSGLPWIESAARRCIVRSWIVDVFDEAIDQWRGRHRWCVCAKGGHFKHSLSADNDFVHICYSQCDLFDFCFFNCEIMAATLANTFLFILQGSALADLVCGDRFYGRPKLGRSSFLSTTVK